MTNHILVEEFELGPLGTIAFLITDQESGEAILVDAPGGAVDLVRERMEGENFKLVALLLTHGHWDHLQDAAAIAALGVPVWAHPADRQWIDNPQLMQSFAFPGIVLEPVTISREIEAGETLDLPGGPYAVRHVPGHSPGNILLYSASLGKAFVGDVIFSGSIGRFDLPGGDRNALETSIREQVYSLPDSTMLHCGHGPATTVGREKNSNAFVRG